MTDRTEILFPVARFVQGDLYDPNTTNFDGEPLVFKTGDNKGKPRVEYFIAIAIKKGSESHWATTEWGAQIWAAGFAAFPGGERSLANRGDFAWKIEDGDSTRMNKKNKRPCDYEGFPGHWIVKFSGGSQPKLVDANGARELIPANGEVIKCGHYVQMFATISGNGNDSNPGVYLNHECVAHSGYGPVIAGGGVDPTTVGFGKSALPEGASAIPLGAMGAGTAAAQGAPPPSGASGAPPAPGSASAHASSPPPPPAAPAAPVATPPPNTQFTAAVAGAPPPPTAGGAAPPPPPAAGPQYVMTGTLGPYNRDQAIASGWTDEQLITAGHMRIG